MTQTKTQLSSRHLVDPALLPLLDTFPTVELTQDGLPAVREALRELSPSDPASVAIDTDLSLHEVPGRDGAPPIHVRMYRPSAATGPLSCIFHIHGGGYVAGAAATMEVAHRSFAGNLGCALVSVDYRLAPETRYPGNLEDCYAAFAWLNANAPSLRIDTSRVGVMGESAGGGLAAALALLTRDRGEFRLAFQHLIYPMLDDRTCIAPDPNPYVGEFIWTPHNNQFGWSAYLGTTPGTPGISEYAAPARARNLVGLPPTFISTGALDLFLEEDIEYARRLMRAGVPTEMHVYPGAFHAFDFDPSVPVAQAARRDRIAWLARALSA